MRNSHQGIGIFDAILRSSRREYFDNHYKYMNELNIFYQALPANTNHLDLTRITPGDDDFPASWLKHLFQQPPLQLSVQPDYAIAGRLQRFYFASRNQERLRGLPALGFGYPLLLWKHEDQSIAAPLFIWQIGLTPAPGSTQNWIFSRNSEDPVAYNRPLAALLNAVVEYDVEQALAKALSSGQLSSKSLLHCCDRISEYLGISNTSQNLAIAECPDAAELKALQQQGVIQWSGIIGLFPPQTLPTALDETRMLHAEVQQKGHGFGLLSLDPHQASALQTIFTNKTSVVEGNAGTGKTHLLTHLLTNALSNGQRCLVVSENLGTLRQIQQRLAQAGLAQYHFLLQNPANDKTVLTDLLRAIANADTLPPTYDETNYRATLDKASRLKQKLDDNYRALRRPVFGPFNWTQTVGQFLRSNRLEGKELLTSQLNPQDFTFRYEEYQQLREHINISYPLYAKVNTLRHPLGDLHESLFTQKNKAESLQYITAQLNAFLDKAESLHYRFLNKINSYADLLTEHYEGRYGEMANRLARLRDQIADYSSRYGADFDQAGAGALKLRGVFSGKVKSVLEARDEVATAYLELVKIFKENPPFEFQFAPSGDGKNIQKVRQNLDAFRKALDAWRENLTALVQEELSRLTAANSDAELSMNEELAELEYALDLLVSELNETKIYQQSFENKTLTILKRQKYLEEIIEQLETSRLYLRDFDHFYDWQRNWLSLPDNAARLVRALVKVKPHDWLQAFESWYLNNCLLIAAQSPLPTEQIAILDFVRSCHQLKALLLAQISVQWFEVREAALKELRRTNKEHFQLLFGKKNQEAIKSQSLQSLLKKGLDAVTAIYPIILATPYAIAQALPEVREHFDYTLFDDAQYLPFGEAAQALQAGKQTVIFGDSSRLPIEDETVLLGWAKARQVPTVKLQTCHRWNPGNLLQLLHSKDMDDDAIGHFTVRFEQLDGRYDEAAGINDEEAQRIIHLLNDIKPNEKRTFPTVGIACFTTPQRDLIASYLLKIKQKWSPGVEKIQQLERNGLGVFHVDELRGQHFDVLIVSTVYGIVDARGNVTRQIDTTLNASDFTSSIRLLMSRPLREVYIINSIPQSTWERWLNMPEQPGIFLLANYFAYNQALERADAGRQQAIAQQLHDWAQPATNEHSDRVFLEEVAIALQPYLGKDRVKICAEEVQLKMPLLIEGARTHQPAIILQPDGFFAQTPFTDYLWEDYQKDLLLQRGFAFEPLWSVNWWKNARQEARRLAGSIIKADAETSET